METWSMEAVMQLWKRHTSPWCGQLDEEKYGVRVTGRVKDGEFEI